MTLRSVPTPNSPLDALPPATSRWGGLALAGILAVLATGCEPTPPPRETVTSTPNEVTLSEPFVTYPESLPSGAQSVVNRPMRRDPVPVVVLAHQLSSEVSHSQPPMARLAERLASRGIATYRVYYDVSPAAEVVNINYNSPKELINDVDILLDQLREQPWVDSGRIGVVGYDIGALIAICASTEYNFQPRALVVWSPPKSFREGFTKFLRHSPGTEEMLVHFEDRRVVLTGEFTRALDVEQPLDRIRQYKGALLGITGADSADGLAALRQYIANSGASSHDTSLIEGADASLGLREKDATATEKAIEVTADWLERAL